MQAITISENKRGYEFEGDWGGFGARKEKGEMQLNYILKIKQNFLRIKYICNI